MGASLKIAISMDRELLRRVDAEASRRALSRSGFIRSAILSSLADSEEEAMVTQLNEAFSDDAARDEQRVDAERSLAASAVRVDLADDAW